MNKNNIALMIVVAIFAIFSVSSSVEAFVLGDRGQEVKDLQITLLEAGFDIPLLSSGVADFGYFGVQTQAALRAYESKGVKLGAVAGPDLYFPYFGVNGFNVWYYSSDMKPAASTTCSFKLPGATTTLEFAGATMTQIASTSVFEIGYSVNPFSTTTLIASKAITTATKDSIVATSSTGYALNTLTPPYTFAPNAYVSYKIGGGSVAGTLPPKGVCKLSLYEI